MDLEAGFAPRVLTMIRERFLGPDDGETVDRLFRFLESTQPTMGEIKTAICEFYMISRQEIESHARRKLLVLARHMFCYFSHRYTRASLNQIRRQIGYDDHTSVYYGVRRLERIAISRAARDQLIRDDLDLLRLRISEKMLRRRDGDEPCSSS